MKYDVIFVRVVGGNTNADGHVGRKLRLLPHAAERPGFERVIKLLNKLLLLVPFPDGQLERLIVHHLLRPSPVQNRRLSGRDEVIRNCAVIVRIVSDHAVLARIRAGKRARLVLRGQHPERRFELVIDRRPDGLFLFSCERWLVGSLLRRFRPVFAERHGSKPVFPGSGDVREDCNISFLPERQANRSNLSIAVGANLEGFSGRGGKRRTDASFREAKHNGVEVDACHLAGICFPHAPIGDAEDNGLPGHLGLEHAVACAIVHVSRFHLRNLNLTVHLLRQHQNRVQTRILVRPLRRDDGPKPARTKVAVHDRIWRCFAQNHRMYLVVWKVHERIHPIAVLVLNHQLSIQNAVFPALSGEIGLIVPVRRFCAVQLMFDGACANHTRRVLRRKVFICQLIEGTINLNQRRKKIGCGRCMVCGAVRKRAGGQKQTHADDKYQGDSCHLWLFRNQANPRAKRLFAGNHRCGAEHCLHGCAFARNLVEKRSSVGNARAVL